MPKCSETIFPTASWFPEPICKGEEVWHVCIGEDLARDGLEMPKLLCWDERRGRIWGRKWDLLIHGSLQKGCPFRKTPTVRTWAPPIWACSVLRIEKAGKHMKGNYSCFSICTHVPLLVLNSCCKSLSFHNVYTEIDSHYFLKNMHWNQLSKFIGRYIRTSEI